MESRAKLFGHPIHQMLIVFPLGLLATSVLFDVVGMARDTQGWVNASYHMVPVGVAAGLIAAAFGLVDWLAIPANTRAKQVGGLHGIGNVLVVVLFALSWYLRRDATGFRSGSALALAFVALVLALGTAWLGGELVSRLGVGVADGAHVDAPSSLSGLPARDRATATKP